MTRKRTRNRIAPRMGGQTHRRALGMRKFKVGKRILRRKNSVSQYFTTGVHKRVQGNTHGAQFILVAFEFALKGHIVAVISWNLLSNLGTRHGLLRRHESNDEVEQTLSAVDPLHRLSDVEEIDHKHQGTTRQAVPA